MIQPGRWLFQVLGIFLVLAQVKENAELSELRTGATALGVVRRQQESVQVLSGMPSLDRLFGA
jgi:hypothetical protein